TPDEPIAEGAILGEALRDRMEAVQLTELFELDFREAVNAFACCWRERPDLRLELAANLRTILPPRETWPREKGEVAGVRLILGLSRSPEFPKAELRWLVAEIRAFLDRDVYEDIHTFPLFLLVWNICASFYDRGLRHKFGDPFTDAELELMLSVLTDRVSAKGPNPEKLEQLALGGLLAISFPQLRSPIINLFASLKGATHWLVALAMDQTFLPALFALEGIALNTDRKIVFSRERCAELLRKFEEYEDVGPAMNALRNHVLSKHKRQ
ncbi:MAG TPA: hypothetical protein DC054_08035, partial [Blastocatellia bacterium]|nr:hypothetical protein [Blastocatellia bacterium]